MGFDKLIYFIELFGIKNLKNKNKRSLCRVLISSRTKPSKFKKNNTFFRLSAISVYNLDYQFRYILLINY